MRRLRSIKTEPISYHVTYCGPEYQGFVEKKDFQSSGSFIEFLRQRYRRQIVRIDQHVEATVANLDLAELLEIDYGAPMFFMEHHYLGVELQVVGVPQQFMKADRYRYSTSIKL